MRRGRGQKEKGSFESNCRAHTLVSKKSMDASCSNPISRQIEIQVSGLQVYIFDFPGERDV